MIGFEPRLSDPRNYQGLRDRQHYGIASRSAGRRRGACIRALAGRLRRAGRLEVFGFICLWRCWAAAPPGVVRRPALSLGKTSPRVLPRRLAEREFAAFLAPLRIGIAAYFYGNAVVSLVINFDLRR